MNSIAAALLVRHGRSAALPRVTAGRRDPAGSAAPHHRLRRTSRRRGAQGERCRGVVDAAGHKVKFVAMTNGDVGHFETAGGPLARRRAEVAECAKILGIETDVLDIHDGELTPSLEHRKTMARVIREWQADIVMGHRPYDYHPDHRYTGVLMDDTAVVVVAPFFVPDTPPTPRNPVYIALLGRLPGSEAVHADDGGRHRRRRREEVAVRLGDAVAVRRQGLVAGPHHSGHAAAGSRARRLPARSRQETERRRRRSVRNRLVELYGEPARKIQFAEAFQLGQCGRQVPIDELKRMFPPAR